MLNDYELAGIDYDEEPYGMLEEVLELYWPGHMEKKHGYVPNIYWALRIMWLFLLGGGLNFICLSGWSENPVETLYYGTSIIVGTVITMFVFAFIYWVVRNYRGKKETKG